LLPAEGPSIEDIVKQTAALVAEHTIDIPRILVKPKGAVSSGYRSFTLDVGRMNFQPQDQQLVGRGLQTGKELLYGQSSFVAERQPEDYIVRELIGFDDIAYDQHGELLYALAAQAVASLPQLPDDGRRTAQRVWRTRERPSPTTSMRRWRCTISRIRVSRRSW
jgi:type III restriction enzyme